MKNIRELSVLQIRLFPVDTIPSIQPLYSILAETIGRTFQFQGYGNSEVIPGFGGLPMPPILPGQPLSLDFQGGRFQIDDRGILFINSLSIEGRRIILQVSGTSEQADSLFESIKAIMISIWPTSELGLSEIVYKAEETTCIADLDLDFSSLFRAKLLSFLEGRLADVISNQRVDANVQTSGLKVKVAYQVKDPSISGHGITLNNKDVIIEPRVNTPYDAGIFFTKSPLPTNQHFMFLEEFEALFKG